MADSNPTPPLLISTDVSGNFIIIWAYWRKSKRWQVMEIYAVSVSLTMYSGPALDNMLKYRLEWNQWDVLAGVVLGNQKKLILYHWIFILYLHFVGGSLCHPSCVAAVHHSFTEINLYSSHNISSIYMHICWRDVQVICIMCWLPQFLHSRIIVKIWIKTPIFAHIILNAISPHQNLRLWG